MQQNHIKTISAEKLTPGDILVNSSNSLSTLLLIYLSLPRSTSLTKGKLIDAYLLVTLDDSSIHFVTQTWYVDDKINILC